MEYPTMHPAFEIEAKIRAYLDRRLELDQLRDWYRSAAGALLSLPPETTASALATSLQLCLIEYGSGGFSERQIKNYLRKSLGSELRIVVNTSPALTTTSSSIFSPAGVRSEPGTPTVTSYQLSPTGTSS
jgi:hypothetical protein